MVSEPQKLELKLWNVSNVIKLPHIDWQIQCMKEIYNKKVDYTVLWICCFVPVFYVLDSCLLQRTLLMLYTFFLFYPLLSSVNIIFSLFSSLSCVCMHFPVVFIVSSWIIFIFVNNKNWTAFRSTSSSFAYLLWQSQCSYIVNYMLSFPTKLNKH